MAEEKMAQAKEVEHSFFCESKDKAQSLAAALTALGHRVNEIEEDEEGGFYVESVEVASMGDAALNSGKLQALAQEHDASYDGWGVSLD